MEKILMLVVVTSIAAALITGLNLAQVAHAQSKGTCVVGSNSAGNPTSNSKSGNPHCFDPEQQPLGSSAQPPSTFGLDIETSVFIPYGKQVIVIGKYNHSFRVVLQLFIRALTEQGFKCETQTQQQEHITNDNGKGGTHITYHRDITQYHEIKNGLIAPVSLQELEHRYQDRTYIKLPNKLICALQEHDWIIEIKDSDNDPEPIRLTKKDTARFFDNHGDCYVVV